MIGAPSRRHFRGCRVAAWGSFPFIFLAKGVFMISSIRQVLGPLLGRVAHPRRAKQPTQRLQARAHCAALGYLTRGPIEHGLIPLDELVLVAVYGSPEQPNRWLAGYGAERVPWGVSWGGVERHRFLKDLSLPPKIGARAARLDLQQAPLVELAFQLSQLLDQERSQRLPSAQTRLELPRLWAGFDRTTANRLKGEGPELHQRCRRRRTPAQELFRSTRRFHRGLVLHPLDWVSHRWRDIACVFADVGHFRKRQVFQLQDPTQDLVGYRGAAEFDLFHSRFRRDGF